MSSEQETIKRLEAENEKLRKEADWLLHVSSVSGTAELLAKLALVTQHRDNLLGEKDMWRADTLSAEDRATTALQRLATVEAALRAAHHDLVTTHNLRATDLDVETFSAHIGNGVPRDQLEWMTNNLKGIEAIDAALASAATDAPGPEQKILSSMECPHCTATFRDECGYPEACNVRSTLPVHPAPEQIMPATGKGGADAV